MSLSRTQFPVLTFIGAGNMANAIISGLIKAGYPAEKIIVASPEKEHLLKLSKKFAISTYQDNCQAVSTAEVIILAVKPAVIPTVCQEIDKYIQNQLILSIAAGKTTTSIKQYLKNCDRIVRAMPNTPCVLSKGITGLFANPEVAQSDKDFVSTLFENIGETVWIENEQQMDIVTALSGSGPAYYFYLTQALIEAGMELGLKEEISNKLVTQTALGSISMLTKQPLQSAEKLRQAVTSPNGTTDAAIKRFEQENLEQIIFNAVQAAVKRGQEMSGESH